MRVPFHTPTLCATIVIDAFFLGLGAHQNELNIQGTWTLREVRLYIHVLELRVVHLACRAFLVFIQSLHIQVVTEVTS